MCVWSVSSLLCLWLSLLVFPKTKLRQIEEFHVYQVARFSRNRSFLAGNPYGKQTWKISGLPVVVFLFDNRLSMWQQEILIQYQAFRIRHKFKYKIIKKINFLNLVLNPFFFVVGWS